MKTTSDKYKRCQDEPEGVSGRNKHASTLDVSILKARDALIKFQKQDGHWCFELEADCTISAEYILMMHFLDEIDVELEQKIAVYLRNRQLENGGWPLYYKGDADISCSVKAYYALKLVGDEPNAPHMKKACELILSLGGAAKANVFTRISLALYEELPWRGVPFIPVEFMLLPRWFWFHISKVSYWSRTVMVPLFILCSLKPKAENPRDIHVRELFVIPPEQEKNYFPIRSSLNKLLLLFDKVGSSIEPFIPNKIRKVAVNKAEQWFIERLNGEDGLGAIFPAMANSYEAMRILGYDKDHPYCVVARNAIKKLLVVTDQEAYCQPCVSPIWDTGLAALVLQEEGSEQSNNAANQAFDWMLQHQILDGDADWRWKKPDLKPGGWAFQYANAYYPDLDDTAVVAWGMHQAQQGERYQEPIDVATDWLVGMQSKNGGFAAFDVDNTYSYLNEIPFADHGALLDPPTADVSARVVTLLALLKRPQDKTALQNCLDYLYQEQEEDGSWFGRWGTNHIYGTWSVLMALEVVGEDHNKPRIRQAVNFLKSKQHDDGGWGESNDSYFKPKYGDNAESNVFQTAWALLGLMAAGEGASSDAVLNGIHYLQQRQSDDGLWDEPWYTCPGFPRVFYLRYHGYSKFFPLWALARYRKQIS